MTPWFVREDDLRPVHEGARDGHALALAAESSPGRFRRPHAGEGASQRRASASAGRRPAPPSIIGKAMFSAAVSSGTS